MRAFQSPRDLARFPREDAALGAAVFGLVESALEKGLPISDRSIEELGRYAFARSFVRVGALWLGAVSLAVLAWNSF